MVVDMEFGESTRMISSWMSWLGFEFEVVPAFEVGPAFGTTGFRDQLTVSARWGVLDRVGGGCFGGGGKSWNEGRLSASIWSDGRAPVSICREGRSVRSACMEGRDASIVAILFCMIYPPVQLSPIDRAYKQPVGEGDYRRYRAPLVLRNKLTAQSKCCPLPRDDDGPHRCTRNKRHGKTDKRETRGQVPREGRPTCRSLSSEGGCMG